MADPLPVTCLKDVWTIVATNVVTGMVWIKNTKPNVYKQTYRDTGEAAPTNEDDAVKMPLPGLPISAEAGIDVYVMPDGEDGEVIVALP